MSELTAKSVSLRFLRPLLLAAAAVAAAAAAGEVEVAVVAEVKVAVAAVAGVAGKMFQEVPRGETWNLAEELYEAAWGRQDSGCCREPYEVPGFAVCSSERPPL